MLQLSIACRVWGHQYTGFHYSHQPDLEYVLCTRCAYLHLIGGTSVVPAAELHAVS